MIKTTTAIWALILAICCVASSVRADVTPEEVEQAITKAKEFLYGEQQKDGTWEVVPKGKQKHGGAADLYGAHTACAVYALLAAGESPQDPRLQKAIEFLMKTEIDLVYSVGVRAQIWPLLPASDKVRQAAARDAKILMDAMNPKGENLGLYHYNIKPVGSFDHSVSQYGVLGMWGCAQAGIEVPPRYWSIVDEAWRKNQDRTGGWAYQRKPSQAHGLTASMTAAGVATLFITQDYLSAAEGASCKGNIRNPQIEAGLAWLAKNFDKVKDGYTWYGIERIGVASGLKYFGKTDWYAAGAEALVKSQSPSGAWQSHGAIPGTMFGILFLVRGRAPVVLNKLEYEIADGRKVEEGNWNQRPRDAANLVRWISGQIERDLNWQTVNLRVPAEELHDAPILYIAGNQELQFTEEDERKLKQFVEQGGLILGHADCARATFSTSFRKLGQKLFNEEFRELPQDHPIYTGQMFQRSDWTSRPSVLGLSNGARELMLLLPQGDPGRYWQMNAPSKKEEWFEVIADIFLYAVDKQNLRYKGQTYIVTPQTHISTSDTIKVARVKYDGKWDPEPGGWRRLAAVLHNEHRTKLEVTPVEPKEGNLNGYPLAHLTGARPIKLDETSRAALKDYVTKQNGTLLIDATGGSGAVAESIATELAAMFPEESKQLDEVLPADHALYATAPVPETIAYRQFARNTLSDSAKAPRLRGIEIDGRLAVIVSYEDLSVGLVGQPIDGIHGYEPSSATALMTQILHHVVDR